MSTNLFDLVQLLRTVETFVILACAVGAIGISIIGAVRILRSFRLKVHRSLGDGLKLMSIDHRIVHYGVIASFAALFVTGISVWLAEPLRTGPNSGTVPLLNFHIYYALLSAGILAFYSTVVLVKHKARLFSALRKPVSVQKKEGYAMLSGYVLGRPIPDDVKSGLGRYNILQTYLALMLAIGLIPLAVGGLAMVFTPGNTLFYLEMEVLHVFGVDVIGLFLVVHLFAVFNAQNRPLLKALFYNGKVPIEWAKNHLAGYLRRESER